MNVQSPTSRLGWYGAYDLTARGSFPFFTEESLRFADQDHNGHVNNVASTIFFENSRVRFLTDVMPLPRSQSTGFVLAHLSIDYRAQLYYPGNVSAGTRVVEVRRSSVVLGQAVFRGDDCVACGHAIMVVIDRASGKGMPLPDALRQSVEGMLVK